LFDFLLFISAVSTSVALDFALY